MVVFLTARDLVVIEDISWVVGYSVFIIIGGIIVRSSYCFPVRESIRIAFSDEWGDIEAWSLALYGGTI